MFKTLRARLLLSYMALIGLTLLIIAAALVLILVYNPLPLTQTYRHLADIGQATNLYIRQPEGLPLDQKLVQTALANNVRVIRINAVGAVVFDSAHILSVGVPLDLHPVRDAEPDLHRYFFRDADGHVWLAVGYARNPLAPAQGDILFATPRPPNRVFALLDDLMLPIAESAAIGIALSVIFAVVISNWVSRPLARTAAAARAIASGNYDHQAPEEGPLEVHDLAKSFNEMASQVQKTNLTQRDFLANVSHELKTPLTSIQGFAQAVVDGAAPQPGDAARVIYDEAGRMRRLVDDLLDLARVETGNAQLRREVLDLRTVLERVADSFQLRAQNLKVNLITEFEPLPALTGDSDRLVQVFSNLFENALTHTPAGGQVIVKTSPVPGGVQVAVADSGKGIPAEGIGRIFERFYQADKSRAKTERKGTGLGLTITRELVQAHGGTIHVESEEGKGTVFYVWLPLPRSSDETARKSTSYQSRKSAVG